jgi:DNA-binding GntR family transcriptional regulator
VTAHVIPLVRNSHVAMYRQLAQRLRNAILQGRYKTDDRLPTEPELIERFGVSRITARQAVDTLVREGLVVRKQGKGTFVAAPRVHYDLLGLRGIYDGLVAQGLDPQTRLLEFRRARPPAYVATRLGTGRRKLLHWRRLYVLRGECFAVSVVYLNPGRTRIGNDDVERHPTYSILENLMHERIGRADVSIRYEPASAEFARILKLKRGAPLMVLERVSYNGEGVPREHSVYRARAEAYEFSLTVRGKLPIARSLTAAPSP